MPCCRLKSTLSHPKHEVEKLALENNIASIEEIINKNSNNIGLVNYAAGLIRAKSPAKAFELIENSIDMMDNDPTQLALIAMVSYAAGEFEIALNSIEKALAKWPNEPEWHRFAAKSARNWIIHPARCTI